MSGGGIASLCGNWLGSPIGSLATSVFAVRTLSLSLVRRPGPSFSFSHEVRLPPSPSCHKRPPDPPPAGVFLFTGASIGDLVYDSSPLQGSVGRSPSSFRLK